MDKMPKEETIFTIFVSSPSDVKEERIALEEIVKDINKKWSKATGKRFELLKWETDTYPDIGESAQELINKQIGDEYDIFIGIFWTRFGTKTKHAESGTEEEFNRAYQKYIEKNNVRISVYFKTTPIDPQNLDPIQLDKIQKFKIRLGELGGLHSSFKTIDEFRQQIDYNLSKYLQEEIEIPHSADTVPVCKIENEEQGLLDYFDIIYENVDKLSPIFEQMNSDIIKLHQNMAIQTEKINGVDYSHPNGRGSLNRYVSNIAFELLLFNSKFEASLNELSDSVDKVFINFQRAYIMAKQYSPDKTELESVRKQLDELIESIISYPNTIDTLIIQIDTLPPIKSNLISAKKKTGILFTKFKEIIRNIIENLS